MVPISHQRYDNVLWPFGKDSTAWQAACGDVNINSVDDQNQILRVVDANSNRAAEGLRAIEDFARLVREDKIAAQWAKELRHQLAELVSRFGRARRLQARSTATDAGTDITTGSELSRESLDAIVPAAAERVSQAMRCLEEYSKLLSAGDSVAFKQLRYRTYDRLAEIELRLRRPGIGPDCQLYVLIDCKRPQEAFAEYVLALAHAGVDLFQLRDKTADGQVLVRYGRAAVDCLRDTRAELVVNDRVDVALACGAWGVHLGQEDISLADARKLVGSELSIGISTHDMDQAIAAEKAGADCIGCGPTFSSTTKTFDQLVGVRFASEATRRVSVPAFAIGGIDTTNIEQVVDAGANRVAVSGAVHNADDPISAVKELKKVLLRG